MTAFFFAEISTQELGTTTLLGQMSSTFMVLYRKTIRKLCCSNFAPRLASPSPTLFSPLLTYRKVHRSTLDPSAGICSTTLLFPNSSGRTLLTPAFAAVQTAGLTRLVYTRLQLRFRVTSCRKRSGLRCLDTARLNLPEFRNQLQQCLALHVSDPNLEMETLDQHCKTLLGALYAFVSKTVGFAKRKHQDWFDENNTSITNHLMEKQAAYQQVTTEELLRSHRRKTLPETRSQPEIAPCTLNSTTLRHNIVSELEDVRHKTANQKVPRATPGTSRCICGPCKSL